jgi:hypothetical protein
MALCSTQRLIGLAFLTIVFNAAFAGTNPTIVLSTYFGGSGSDAATSVALDPSGNIYITGWTDSSNLPVTAGAFQTTKRGGVNAFVAKFNPSGSALLYCTYLGGSVYDQGLSIAVDAAGNAYVAGATSSPDFPVTGQSRFQGGRKAFVAKLSPTGGSLIYSTFLGGSGDDGANGIAVNSAGDAFVAGATYSTDFPTVSPIQSASGGQQDAFVAELDSTGANLLFSTYLGGMGNDSATAIALDASGNVYVTGATGSPNFPVLGAIQSALGGSQDAFVSKLNPTTHTLVYSTYLGGGQGWSGYPQYGAAIDVDPSGAAYVAGTTNSPNFPVENAFEPTFAGFTNAFLAKLNAAGNALVYSTYLGGHLDQGNAVRVNAAGAACVAGATGSPNFPLTAPLQSALGGIWDAFVSCFTPAGNSLSFSTYVGGSGSDGANGLALSGSSIYVVGQTQSMDFPLTSALQTWNGGSFSAFVTAMQIDTGLEFYPVPSCRIADTRSSSTMTGAFGPPSLAGGTSRTFSVVSAGCGIPSIAAAYSLNVTALPSGYLGYVTVWPTGKQMPLASTSNSWNGAVVSNAAIIPAGTGGSTSIFASNQTDILLDVNGYFAPPQPSGLQFYPVVPCRVADTRSYGGLTGAFGPPSLAGGAARAFPVPASSCNIPSSALAYSVNVTVVPSDDSVSLTTWPTGQRIPIGPTSYSSNGAVVAAETIVAAGTGGSISIYASNPTDALFDINGYFAPPQASGLQFYPVTPCRVADTRSYGGETGAFGPPSIAGGSTRTLPVTSSPCGVPSSAQAFLLNLTVVPYGYLGYLTAWPTGRPFPLASNLNSWSGAVVANAAIVPAGTGGAINIFASNLTDVVVDIFGYLAP